MDSSNIISTSKTSNIKSLLMEAWRERWSPIHWGVNIKRVIPRGVSGDVYDLSNCILVQSLIGPTPNSLFISYLNHCISSQIVSYGAVLTAIAKYHEFNKSQCIICLLGKHSYYILFSIYLLINSTLLTDLGNNLKHRINCYGNEEECIFLAKSLVSYSLWLYSVASHALARLSELKSHQSAQNLNQLNHLSGAVSSSLSTSSHSNEYLNILEKIREIFAYFSNSSFLKALIHVGKLEDTHTYQQLFQKASELENKLTGPILSHLNKDLIDMLSSFLKFVEWNNTDPTIVAKNQLRVSYYQGEYYFNSLSDSVFRCLNTVIAFDAILNPTNDIEVCAKQILLIAKFTDLPLSDLFCEIIHACFIRLSESGDDLKWTAFTFLKVPHLFNKLSILKNDKNINAELTAGLVKFVNYYPSLDVSCSRSNSDGLALFLNELCKTDLTQEQKEQILSLRHKEGSKLDRIVRNDGQIIQGSQGQAQGPGLILQAEPTVTSIIKTLDSDNSKNQDSLLRVLNRMIPNKSFELILSAAAATGKLRFFATKLIKINEFNKQTSGEGGKASQTRALLFDTTFLMLCHIAQNYGTELITGNAETKDSFFPTWCGQSLSQNGRYHSPDSILSNADPVKVDMLLAQFNSTDSEMKTSLVKWHEICQNAPSAIKEVLLAWEHDAISTDTVKTILDNIKSKMCCLPVVISAWLCSYINTLHNDERLKPMNMIKQFMTPLNIESGSENGSESSYYKERSYLMSTLIKKMWYDLYPPYPSRPNFHGLTIEVPLWEIMESKFNAAHDRSWLKDVYGMDTLFSVGGPNWFVEVLIRQLLKFDNANDLHKAVDLIFGLFHLDIEQCALCLLVNVLTGYLLNEDKQESFTEPKASAIARLTVMTIYSALSEMENRKAGKPRGMRRSDCADILVDFEPMEEKSNGNSSNPRPAKMRRTDSQSSLNLLDDTPFALSMGPQMSTSILNEPLTKAIADLLRLFTNIITDSMLSQRTLFPLVFLEQLILCTKMESQKILQLLPFQTIISLIKIVPATISFEFVLAISNLKTPKARKIIARALCQLKRAKKNFPRLQ